MTKTISKNCSPLEDRYRLQLKVNEEARFNHEECGDTKQRLYVRRTRSGWLYHCHNCAPKFSGFMRHTGVMTPEETIKIATNVIDITNKVASKKTLPKDFVPDIPLAGWQWLQKYEITPKETEFYGIGYSPGYNRLVLPVYNLSGLVGWQGRALKAVEKGYPKYMTFANGEQPRLWFDSRHGVKFRREYLETNKIVFVEDIISAIKVGRQVRTVALLGSYVRPELIQWMQAVQKLQGRMRFFLWLDPDKRVESHQIVGKLKSLGINISVIATDRDPKEESSATIQEEVE
jgi:hypothetical protein